MNLKILSFICKKKKIIFVMVVNMKKKKKALIKKNDYPKNVKLSNILTKITFNKKI